MYDYEFVNTYRSRFQSLAVTGQPHQLLHQLATASSPDLYSHRAKKEN